MRSTGPSSWILTSTALAQAIPGSRIAPTAATTPSMSAPSNRSAQAESLKSVLPHLLSLILPFTVLIIVPALIEPQRAFASGLQLAAGVSLLLLGLFLLGVIVVLLGEAFALRSWPIFVWAVFVYVINTIYFMFSEEPGLEKRFGEEYRAYKRNVPRCMPRRTPWRPDNNRKEQQ